MRQYLRGLIALVLFTASQAMAHHSFAAFDLNKTVVIQGELTVVRFTNPHSWFEVKVAGAEGKSEMWKIEGLSPQQLCGKWMRLP